MTGYPREIEDELARGRRASNEGNEGMARVCARRAVGAAIRRWPVGQPRGHARRRSALGELRALAVDGSVPRAVREAAARLSTAVAEDHTLPFDENPLDDARFIVDYLSAAASGGGSETGP